MAHTTENSTGYLSLTSTATAIGMGVRVKLDSNGLISAAGVSDPWIGVMQYPVPASSLGTVRLRNSTGSYMVCVSGAVAVGALLYPAASGKFSSTQSAGPSAGLQAKIAAGADGDIIEAVPCGEGGASGGNVTVLQFPIVLATVANGDVVTAYPLTFAGTITSVNFLVTTAVTTAAKAATLNLEIGTTNLTGGVVALTSANCTPLGAVVAGTAVTAANTFISGDTLSVEASSVTTFVEGAGTLLITIAQN